MKNSGKERRSKIIKVRIFQRYFKQNCVKQVKKPEMNSEEARMVQMITHTVHQMAPWAKNSLVL